MKTACAGLVVIISVLLLTPIAPRHCLAEDPDDHIAFYASESVAPFVILGELVILGSGDHSREQAIQGAKAVASTILVTQALKLAVHEKRPNSDSETSFPSGHTSAAFAMAGMVSAYKPKYTMLAYGVATVIGWSRVETGAHRVHDVIAGALIGHYAAKFFANTHIAPAPNGLAFQWKW